METLKCIATNNPANPSLFKTSKPTRHAVSRITEYFGHKHAISDFFFPLPNIILEKWIHFSSADIMIMSIFAFTLQYVISIFIHNRILSSSCI